jgi:hypothetical protein
VHADDRIKAEGRATDIGLAAGITTDRRRGGRLAPRRISSLRCSRDRAAAVPETVDLKTFR